jgi:hypothetical protein
MDIGKSFTYVFEDQKWIMKVLIGGIVLLIPIVDFAVLGYMLTTLKNVADGQTTPLPEWGDFGNHFMKGLYAFIGLIVYLLPALVLLCCAGIVGVAGSAAAGAAGRDTAGLAGVVGILATCVQCVGYLIYFVLFIGMYAPLTRFAMSQNQLSLFWDFRGNLDFIMKNIANYIIALLLSLVAGFVAEFGLILCIIGVVFTIFWAQMVTANLFGQLWRTSQGQGSVPAAA